MESEALGGARVDDVDGLRARHYDLLAVLLGRPPGQDLLDTLAGLSGGGGILGQHVADLSRAAAETTGAEV
ncbi:molecular chaperone TorD, partial [Escherichia coli]|nr:molecular chaperone TorD [Escherichia coli]